MFSAHWRIAALFFIHALAIGAVQTRIPDLQLLNNLSEAQLGLVLMGQPLGGLPMFLVSSAIIERFGPRKVILWFLRSSWSHRRLPASCSTRLPCS